jgi:two-component system response regulator FixJ
MDDYRPTVFIVDDDPAVRESMTMLMASAGLPSRAYPSATDFLGAYEVGAPGCLVLDVRMPGMSGTELQAQLDRVGADIPIVFLTAYADIPVAVDAVRAGAVDFLTKPVDAERLLDRVRDALRLDLSRREHRVEEDRARRRLDALTPREREVLRLVVSGLTNKGIAKVLGLSRRTVETHRANIRRKIGATSLPELVRAAAAGGVGNGENRPA